MRKISRKAVVLLMAVAMIIAMAVPTFATTGNGWYTIGNATEYNNPIYVKLVIQSRQKTTTPSGYLNIVDTVKLGEENVEGQTFTVSDVLVAFNAQQSTYEAQTSGETAFLADSVLYNMVHHASSGDIVYGPLLYDNHGYTNRIKSDGWMFRVNGKIPFTDQHSPTTGEQYGADSTYTYVEDGDVVYFYTDYPWYDGTTKLSNLFVSADTSYTAPSSSSEDGTLSVQLKSTDDVFSDWNGSTFPWTINDFASYAPGTRYSATIKELSINTDGSTTESTFATVPLNTSGAGSISCTLDSSKRYYITVTGLRNWQSVTAYAGSTGSNTITVKHLKRSIAYDRIDF